MGKPYQSELSRLTETFDWAISQPIEGLAKSLRAIGQTPMIVVGSGGSLAACQFAAQLRQQYAGVLAKAMTPLEYSHAARELKSSVVMVISAGGRNPDIIAAFRAAAIAEVPRIILLGGNSQSPLVSLGRQCNRADVHTFVPPTGKDGFLATNSLLSFYTILYRAQLKAAGGPSNDDTAFVSMLPDAPSLSDIEKRSVKLWDRDHLIILHGPSLLSVGADLESRFVEAALGTVQRADYRNFAHGQHYWLSKRSKETALIAFVTSTDREIASKTLALIPADIPRAEIDVPGTGLSCSIWGLVTSMRLAGFAGLAKGLDPGRPVVPDFGRKLYHLKARSGRIGIKGTPPSDFVISRKNDRGQNSDGIDQLWSEALSSFRDRIEAARYFAVVLDYDGTLCNRADRFSPLAKDISLELTRLLEAGICIGVATGRGKSVRSSLQAALPKAFWSRVLVGYYSGGEIGTIEENNRPNLNSTMSSHIKKAAKSLDADPVIGKSCQIEVRPRQISVVSDSASTEELWLRACEALVSMPSMRVFTSGHSIDILDEGVSKMNLVNRIRELNTKSPGEILCIGDRGRWPGNDCELLAHPYSLSVDQVSYDPHSCWNLAPAGCSGLQATLYYLRNLRSLMSQTVALNPL